MKHHHYHVRPKDTAIHEATTALRAAHAAQLEAVHQGDDARRAANEAIVVAERRIAEAHAMSDGFVCDACGKGKPLAELVLIPFLRVIKGGVFYLDDGREKYLRLCSGCDGRLNLIKHNAE